MQTEANFEDFLDAEVVDRAGNFVGNLSCFWVDEEGEPAFLGIKSNLQPDQTWAVPARLAETDERQSCIWLKIGEEKLRTAPALDCDKWLSPDFEMEVYDHFQIEAPVRRQRLQINKAAVAQGLHPVPDKQARE